MNDRPFGRLFLPGPTDVHPDIRAATGGPIMSHLGPAMAELLERIEVPLRELFPTVRPVMLGTCSATGFMEAAVRNGVRRRMLAVVGGYFGERFAAVAEACGKQVVRAMVPPGATLSPAQLERFLDGPPIDAVSICHSETATGALADLEGLARVVRQREDLLLLVDGVTSLGAMEVDVEGWGIDFIFTGSQKALALPPGLALGVASPRMLERAASRKQRGWYLDLLKFDAAVRAHKPTQTPATPLILALAAQLDRIAASGGRTARWERHATMATMMAQWADEHPRYPLLAQPGSRSPAVSVLKMPEGVSATALVQGVAARGYYIAAGLPPHEQTLVRIGHMGDLTPEHMQGLLSALSEAVAECDGAHSLRRIVP